MKFGALHFNDAGIRWNWVMAALGTAAQIKGQKEGDEILPSYVGIIVNHYKDPYCNNQYDDNLLSLQTFSWTFYQFLHPFLLMFCFCFPSDVPHVRRSVTYGAMLEAPMLVGWKNPSFL